MNGPEYLPAGTRLGPYEIIAPIGAGGMGEVYRASDTRLRREVAIKLSSEQFAQRFAREARAIAALNHPNICTLYDVGTNYFVMELVEGPTLADRIKKGALSPEETLGLGRQLTNALEAAHEKGIIHRDLKPANIKIKSDGVLKVLDFGLARISEDDAASKNPEDFPTRATEKTRTGQIVGTPYYMSPEQARGKKVDRRTDIWAFGVVLYEMLTGRQPFDGDTVSDALVSVLTKEPDWKRVPPKMRRLLRSCLEKEPKDRLRDIGDVWRLLDDTEDAPPVRSSRAPWIVAGALMVLSLLGGLIWALWRVVPPTDRHLVTIDLDLGAGMSPLSESASGSSAILSPDGERIVLVVEDEYGTRRLFTRRLNQANWIGLTKTEGAFSPFFSPDGQWVGFFADGNLIKTRVEGGDQVILCEAPGGRGGTWNEDGTIVAALDINTGLSQVNADGGKPTLITEVDAGEISHRWPEVLPGGKAVIFTIGTAPSSYDGAKTAVVSLVDRRKKILVDGAMFPRYLHTGHIAYVSKGTLFAAPFDLSRLAVRGPGMPLLRDLANDLVFGSAQYAVSTKGAILYRQGRTFGQRTVQWLDSEGKSEAVLSQPSIYQMPRLSPDGSRLAFIVTDGPDSDLWVFDFQQGSRRRLTQRGVNSYEVWSPDGNYLVYQSKGGTSWVRADGADSPQPFTMTKTLQRPSSFLPAGQHLALFELSPGGGSFIRTVALQGSPVKPKAGQTELLIQTVASNPNPAFSSDGRWLAYSSTESGTYEVYVRRFPDNGTKVQVSNRGGNIPIWSRTSNELFYRTEDQRIMVTPYTIKGDSFISGKPRLWSSKQLANTGATPNLDLAPDGKRFIVLMPAGGSESRETRTHLKIAVNFFDEVRRRAAPTSK